MKGIPSINFLWKLSTTAKFSWNVIPLNWNLRLIIWLKFLLIFGPIKVPKLLELQQHFQKMANNTISGYILSKEFILWLLDGIILC